MATFYLAIYPQGAATPTWNRANVATNAGFSGSPVYTDADTDPGSGSTYQFTPDASGLSASTPYDAYAIWDDGTTTSSIVSHLNWSTTAAGASVTVSPAAGAFAAVGYVPGLVQPHTVAPAAGAVAAQGFTPSIVQPRVLTPAAGAVSSTGYAPIVLQPRTAAPAAGAVTTTGYAPGIVQTASVRPQAGQVIAQGYAPGISQPRTIAPATGPIVVTGFAPAVSQASAVRPTAGSLSAAGYAPGISQPRTIAPSIGTLLVEGFAPSVSNVTYPLTLAQAQLLFQIYLLHGLHSAPLQVSPTARSAGTLVQAVSTAAGVTLVETEAAPFEVPVAVGLMIEELAALHGLTVPLQVSADSRVAGVIEQTFATASGVTTVTRV